MNTLIHKHYFISRRIFAAGLCIVALLVAVISCPVKKIKQGQNFFTSLSSAQNADQALAQASTSANYTQKACCAVKQQTLSINAHQQQAQAPSPDAVFFHEASGFAINYFLSGTSYQSHSQTSAHPALLPLFLQHRRLLI